ncbi:MAG: hypothetical protein GC168_18560 [Candidatus Hydrogenedens sp.]|nr:hypothetical protein [Candidatus Hydrogenedens sp.]
MMSMAKSGRRPAPGIGWRLCWRVLAPLVLVTGCIESKAPPPTTAAIVAEPTYVFNLGVHYDDVVAMLGPAGRGSRFDRYSNSRELVYAYGFPAFEAETLMPDGTVRKEMTDHIHLFFNFDGVLIKMVAKGNRFYSYVSEMPIHRITVLPRVTRRLLPNGYDTQSR